MEKNKRISARCDEQEYQIFLEKCEQSKLSKAEFVRNMILKTTVKEVDRDHQKRVIFLLNNLANNVNQIAHHANINKQLDIDVLNELKEISDFAKEVVNAH